MKGFESHCGIDFHTCPFPALFHLDKCERRHPLPAKYSSSLFTPRMVNQKAFTATYQPEKMLLSLRGFPLPVSEAAPQQAGDLIIYFMLISTQNYFCLSISAERIVLVLCPTVSFLLWGQLVLVFNWSSDLAGTYLPISIWNSPCAVSPGTKKEKFQLNQHCNYNCRVCMKYHMKS